MATNLSIQDLEQQSLATLKNQSIANLLWIILGVAGTVTNGLTLVIVWKSKDLHNKSQYAICSHAVAAIMYASSFFLIGTRKYFLHLLARPGLLSQLSCAFWQTPSSAFSRSATSSLLALGIDRFVAIFAPFYYSIISVPKHVFLFNFFCFGVSFAYIVSAFATLNGNAILENTVAICSPTTAFAIGHRQFWNLIDNITIGSTTVLYVFTLAKVGLKYWCTKWSNSAQRGEWSRRVQLTAFKSICIIFSLYIVSFGLSLLYNNLNTWNFIPVALHLQISPFTGLITFIDNTLYFFVYLCTNKEFRKTFFRFFRSRRSNNVEPFN